jgi:hypothetical protein
MKYTLLFIFSFILLTAKAQTKDEKAILLMLKTQEAAWNEGSLEKFMIGYWQSDSLMFIGKNGPTYSYEKTLANYKKGYPDTAHMGNLRLLLLA